MSITNSGNRDFGSVFRIGAEGGPRYSNVKNSVGLPSWPDLRTPGNTSSNEQASRIIERWEPNKMKRFEIFMERFYRQVDTSEPGWMQDFWRLTIPGYHPEYRDTSLFRKEWLDKTTGNYFKSGELKIVKCKLELIKRLLIMKVLGPQSLEDWILLFMYHDNELAIPPNLEQMMRPDSALVDDDLFLQDRPSELTTPRGLVITASANTMEYPANMSLYGLGHHGGNARADRPRYNTRAPRGLTPEQSIENTRQILNRVGTFPRGSAPGSFGVYSDARLRNNPDNIYHTQWETPLIRYF